MPFLEKNTTALIGIIGIIVGWLLTQFAQWYKGKKEDNRVRKEVLFYLLELKFDLDRLNIGKHLDNVIEMMLKSLGEESNLSEVRAGFKKIIYPHLMPVIKNLISSPHSLNNESLKDAISKLSSVSPYLAYRLTAFTNIMARVEGVQQYINSVSSDPILKGGAAITEEILNPIVEKSAFEDTQDDLSQILRQLAFRIHPITYIYQLLWQRRFKKNQQSPNYLDELEAIIPRIMSGLKNGALAI